MLINPITRGARDFLRDLLHRIGSVADPSSASPTLREVIDYLEIEGIIVRVEVGDFFKVQLAAPLLRVVLLSYFNVFDQSRVPSCMQLPMKNHSCRHLDLLGCIRQSLPFMDRKRMHHQSCLQK